MSLRFYVDVHVRREVTVALRLREVDVLTSQTDATTRLADSDLLDRATSLGRVLFSQDSDLLKEAVQRQRSTVSFAGLVYAHQLRVTIGRCISDLELMAKIYNPEDIRDRIEHLPLR